MMLCSIWYHLCNLKNVKNTHRGVLVLVKLQDEASNFNKSNNHPRVFFTFFKLYKWYQIAHSVSIKSPDKFGYARSPFCSEDGPVICRPICAFRKRYRTSFSVSKYMKISRQF